MLNQQQQRIKLIIISAMHVAAYIIATHLFTLSLSVWAGLQVGEVHVLSLWEFEYQHT